MNPARTYEPNTGGHGTHIRFEDQGAVELEPGHRQHHEIRRPKKKRKRSHTPTSKKSDEEPIDSTTKKLFNGLTMSISTLESKETQVESGQSMKSVKQTLISQGAMIAPQVHKRVRCIICTPQAIENLTQRVRQALKRGVDIVDIKWLNDSVRRGKRLEVDGYLRNDLARALMAEKKEQDDIRQRANNIDEVHIPDHATGGWSEPIELDCCCVCHENGDFNCPWCTNPDCNVYSRMRKAGKFPSNSS